MTDLKKALISNDYTPEEADKKIEEMRSEVWKDGRNPEEVLSDAGLEPDYIFDLID